jgi:hypothetical protein
MGTRINRSPESPDALADVFGPQMPTHSASYSAPSSLTGLGLAYDHSIAGGSSGLGHLVPRTADPWSQVDFITSTTTAVGCYPAWSPQTFCIGASTSWADTNFVSYSNLHCQQSSAQTQYTDAVPGLLSSPCTTISTRCNTPSDRSSLEDLKRSVNSSPVTGMTPRNEFEYSTSHTPNGQMLYCLQQSPSAHGYDDFGLLIPASDSSLSPPAHAFTEVKQEPLPEFNDYQFRSPEPVERRTYGLSEKIRVMDEKTKLVRKRHPNHAQVANRPKCTTCNKHFSRSHNLHQHILRMHTLARIKPHRCSDCGLEFDRPADLLRHQVSVSIPPLVNTEPIGSNWPVSCTLRRSRSSANCVMPVFRGKTR